MPKNSTTIDLMAETDGGHGEDNIMPVDPTLHDEASTLLDAEQTNMRQNITPKFCITMRGYYSYLFQIRRKETTSSLRTGCLVQQFQIDSYVKLETQGLDFLRQSQSKLEVHAESYQWIIYSMAIDGFTRAGNIGKRILLHKSFTGGPRDLMRRYMNDLALVMKYGWLDIFLTMTCNPKWEEIQR